MTPISRAVRFYEAPIGKKAVMAITGLMLVGYVIAHLLGNLQIYSQNREQINIYAAFLHNPSNALLLWTARAVLLAAVLLHEPLSGSQIAGGVMVLIGVGVAHRQKHPEEEANV